MIQSTFVRYLKEGVLALILWVMTMAIIFLIISLLESEACVRADIDRGISTVEPQVYSSTLQALGWRVATRRKNVLRVRVGACPKAVGEVVNRSYY